MIDGHRGWSGRGRDPAEAEWAIAVKCGTSPSAAPAGILASGHAPHSSGRNRAWLCATLAMATPATTNPSAATTMNTENSRMAVSMSTSG